MSFYIYAPKRSGRYRGTRLLGARADNITLQDLLDFLQTHGIKPATVALSGGFSTRTLQHLLPGTRVQTTRANPTLRGWTREAAASRQWGVFGKIHTHHDSHGLSYEVEHPDGSIGHYDPSELEVL